MWWPKKANPFGIDVGGLIPEPQKKITIEIEEGGTLTFDPADEPLFGLIAQAAVASTGVFMIINSPEEARRKFTITDWNTETRHLKVRVNKR